MDPRHDDDDHTDSSEGVDVHALLAAVVDKPPPADLADRVTSRLALVETVTELGRLFGLVAAKAATESVSDDVSDSETEERGNDDDE